MPIDVITLDLELIRKNFASSHLLHLDGSYALVDVGAASNASTLRSELLRLGVNFEQVAYLFVTHVHLDHAGAAGLLLRDDFPQAKLVVHPLGARHLAEPARLEQAARQVYGDAEYEKVYGSLIPVPETRILLADFSEPLPFGPIPDAFRLVDTPGHARHHYALHLPHEDVVFVGDTLGVAYPELSLESEPFVFPSTTPAAFNPDDLRASVAGLFRLGCPYAYMTHFGRVHMGSSFRSQLESWIDRFCACTESVADLPPPARHAALKGKLKSELESALRANGRDVAVGLSILELDLELNVMGLLCWLERKQKTNTPVQHQGEPKTEKR